MILQGKAIYLRTVVDSDINLLLDWENNPTTQAVSTNQEIYTHEQIRDFVKGKHNLISEKQLRLMICLNDSDEAIGTLDLFEYDSALNSVGIGILIYNTIHRSKGYARESLNTCMQYLVEKTSIETIFCNIQDDNTKSISLFTSLDFNQLTTFSKPEIFNYKLADAEFYIKKLNKIY